MGQLWIKYTQLVDILLINGNFGTSFSHSIFVGKEKMPFLSIFQNFESSNTPPKFFFAQNQYICIIGGISASQRDMVHKNWIKL